MKIRFLLLFMCSLLGVFSAKAQTGSGDDGNISWELVADGTFTVSGSGAMTDHTSSSVPWNGLKTHIVTVVIEEGVTTIGEESFSMCTNLTSVTIGKDVESINDGAFYNCTNLPSITIPQKVNSIGTASFATCTSLTEITVESSTPPTVDGYTFDSVDLNDVTLNIPEGSKTAYNADAVWSSFGTISDGTSSISIVDHTPGDGAIDVAVDAEISVTFSGNVSATDLSLITIQDDQANNVNNVSASITDNVLTITHDNFEYETEYTVTIPENTLNEYDAEITWTFTTAADQEFAGGDGTEDAPYQITTAKHLNNVRNYLDKHFILMNNIVLADDSPGMDPGKGWKPIGTNFSSSFAGSFDGNKNTISGIWIDDATLENAGFFGFLKANSSVSNLTLSLAEKGIKAKKQIGGLAGYSYTLAKITSCKVSGNITGESAIGGLIGANYQSIISDCHTDVVINGSSSWCGGLIGLNYNEGAIFNCSSKGSVTSTEGDSVGGFIGSNSGGIVFDCFSSATVNAKSRLGGFVGGISSSGSVSNCYSTGSVNQLGTIKNDNIASFIGSCDDGSVKNCYATGPVSVIGEKSGFIGTIIKGNISGCYFDAVTTGATKSVNKNDNNVVITGITASTTDDMQKRGSFKGWGFLDSADDYDKDKADRVWFIRSYETYPFLYWEEGEPNYLEGEEENPGTGEYHTINIEVASGINLHNLAAGNHQVEDGSHLQLQFLPEDATATADDIIFLIDGVETAFKDFGASNYYSYILNPINQDHSVLIAMKEYIVTLPNVEGVTFDIGSGAHSVDYGEKFTFTLTLADGIDPADVHVYANGTEIYPEALRATTLTYIIDKVIGPITVRIDGAGDTVGNANIAEGGVQLRITNYELGIENTTGQAVDVVVYTITGKNVASLRALRGSKTITLQPGIYIVRAGTMVQKVVMP